MLPHVRIELRVERVIRIDLCQAQVEVGPLRLRLQLIVQLLKHFLVVWLRLCWNLLESTLLI